MTTVQSKAMSCKDFLSLQSFAKAYGLMNTPIDKVIPRWKEWKQKHPT